MELLPVLLTFGVALIGGFAALRLRIPAGAIVGAIVLVAAANILFGVAEIPPVLKLCTQIIAGAFIGAGMDRESLRTIRRLAKPALILVVSLLTVTITLGLLLYRFSSMDLCTALFAVSPGGITEMAVIADDMGADTATVSVFQLARLTATMCIFPVLIPHIMHAERSEAAAPKSAAPKQRRMDRAQWGAFAITLFVAGATGAVGYFTRFPGGVLLFSVLGVSALKLITGIGVVPKSAKRLAQVLTGAYIGAKISRSVITGLVTLWPYALLVVAGYLIFCLLIGILMSKVTCVDRVTAAFSCAPAGSSDMALIASEFATVTPTIAALQIVRLISVVALYPTIISLLCRSGI